MKIKQILKDKKEIEVEIKGWILFNRGNAKIRFITINDGSTFDSLQVVVKDNIELVESLRTGSAISVKGNVVLTEGKEQPLEVVATNIEVLKESDEDYPIQKQGINLETLREIPHVRHRTNTFRAVMRVRSTLAQKIHEFFGKEGYLLCSAPIITSNDGEGAGEAFVVDDESKDEFFGTKATLGVTGQLHGESYANGFGDIYTFAPTFRAEHSNTTRHAAEFWMIEPEVAFADLPKIINVADRMLKYVVEETMKELESEFKFLDGIHEGLKDKLNNLINNEVQTLDYSDAIKKLQEVKDQFENKDIEFGTDLSTEHERYLTDVVYKAPVAVINYPKDIKAFYMYQNDDNKTVAAFDLLVPGIGELIGGSQGEANYSKLETRIDEMGIPKDDLQWYLNLRKWGYAMSAGFGLGFERLVMYVTGMENIRDVIPYPRTPRNLKM